MLSDLEIRPLESDPIRRADMAESLSQEYRDHNLNGTELDRIDWLLARIGEYLDRWVGCLRLFDMTSFVHNDLHFVMLLGIDLADTEIHSSLAPRDVINAWDAFATSFRSITGVTDKAISHQLVSQLANVRITLDRWRASTRQ